MSFESSRYFAKRGVEIADFLWKGGEVERKAENVTGSRYEVRPIARDHVALSLHVYVATSCNILGHQPPW